MAVSLTGLDNGAQKFHCNKPQLPTMDSFSLRWNNWLSIDVA